MNNTTATTGSQHQQIIDHRANYIAVKQANARKMDEIEETKPGSKRAHADAMLKFKPRTTNRRFINYITTSKTGKHLREEYLKKRKWA